MLGNRFSVLSCEGKSVVLIVLPVILGALCTSEAQNIRSFYSALTSGEEWGGRGIGLAQRSAQLTSALSHHRAQHAGNHLFICHEIPGRRKEPESELPYQAPTESQIEAHQHKRANKENETGFGKEMESLHLSRNADPMAKVTSSLKTSENMGSQSVRQCLLSVHSQHKEYFPNCCGPLQ